MLVKVRNYSDSNKEIQIKISKTAKISRLKDEIEKILAIKSNLQKLYYSGKHLELENTLYDYKINTNDVIQLMVKSDNLRNFESCQPDLSQNPNQSSRNKQENFENFENATSDYYAIEDPIDCLDFKYGAWFEATIKKICIVDNKVTYVVKWDLVENPQLFYANEESIRPRANKVIAQENLKVGEIVMINHNLDHPSDIGFWYDFQIKRIFSTYDRCILTGSLYIGKNNEPLYNHRVVLRERVYAIETPKLVADRNSNVKTVVSNIRRAIAPECLHCQDQVETKCTECGCVVCGGKSNPHLILICDECEDEYHTYCLNPPFLEVPEDDWYCAKCKNDENEIVKVGQLVKKRLLNKCEKIQSSNEKQLSKKQLVHKFEKTQSSHESDKISLKKSKPIVPRNHKGSIPGIEVGACWSNRIELFNAGVHAALVSGIHGHINDCAYSLILSGSYDDIDNGNEFIYTGAGGYGKKGVLKQPISDQTLTRGNKALALNCKAKFNDQAGSTATDWRAGIPVRVIRSYKFSKYSQYAPTEGNRYDGLYKVVKYYPEIDANGFRKWRYLLKRDDPVPPPWTPEGRIRSMKLGLTMNSTKPCPILSKKACQESQKRPRANQEFKNKQKTDYYHLNSKVLSLMETDSANSKLWRNCKSSLPKGKKKFLNQIFQSLQCVCCHELVVQPVTTPCSHNICSSCLEKSLSAGLKSCPTCRFNLNNISISVNKKLSKILSLLFPKYDREKK